MPMLRSACMATAFAAAMPTADTNPAACRHPAFTNCCANPRGCQSLLPVLKPLCNAPLQVRNLVAEGVAKTKVKTSDFRFKPVKGWLGGEVTEKMAGWRTRVYEVDPVTLSCSLVPAPGRGCRRSGRAD